MKVALLTALLAVASAQPPQSGIPCNWLNSPVDVPKDPKLYLGTWYTIGITTKAWTRNHECTQVNIAPGSGDDLGYTGATFASNSSQTTPNINLVKYTATLVADDLKNFNPPYQLQFPFPGAQPNPFYIAATDGDGTPEGITAVAFYACGAGGSNNTQLFYLSRAPYFMTPVTVERLAAKVAHTVGNHADIQMDLVAQGAGWCDYPFKPTTATRSVASTHPASEPQCCFCSSGGGGGGCLEKSDCEQKAGYTCKGGEGCKWFPNPPRGLPRCM